MYVNALNALWFGPAFILTFIFIARYRCSQIDAVRAKVREIYDNNPDKPIIICSNHLTMIDSMLLTWFLFPTSRIARGFRYFPWNVPEIRNFGRNIGLRIMCYLGKCVFVDRKAGASANTRSLAKLSYLLSKKESVCLFPEGGRSRSGRIEPEECSYGVGTLMEDQGMSNVLMVYLRGHKQKSFSFFPRYGESFHIEARWGTFKTEHSGRRAARDLTMQIMTELKGMEDAYFAGRHPDRFTAPQHHQQPDLEKPSKPSKTTRRVADDRRSAAGNRRG